jgi:hypothetical protein
MHYLQVCILLGNFLTTKLDSFSMHYQGLRIIGSMHIYWGSECTVNFPSSDKVSVIIVGYRRDHNTLQKKHQSATLILIEAWQVPHR